jgi:hypothetical protein
MLGVLFLEESIKRIITIDREAEAYREKKTALLKEKKLQFEEELKNMKTAFENKLAAEKKNIQDTILNKAEGEVKQIVENRNEAINKMQEKYKLMEDSIVQELFSELKEKMKEG